MAAPTSAPSMMAAPARTGAASIPDRVRARWAGMAGRLGLGLSSLGFLVIAIAWNGAAGLDYAQGQLPYLLSGGFGGLGLIITGAALTLAESHRRDRAILEGQLRELSTAIARIGAPGTNGYALSTTAFSAPVAEEDLVIAGRSSFHRPTCRLVAGRDDGTVLTIDDAEADGLAPCRVCKP